MDIRPLKSKDQEEWVRLKLALWPESEPEEIWDEMPAYLEGGDRRLHTVVAERPNGKLGGILELSLRGQAEGCLSSPVAYVEGCYVDEDLRKQGVATALFDAGCRWARHRGCSEVASVCIMENEDGIQVHEALGFEEVDRLVHFVYTLEAEG